ncbi:MAG TPA: FAD-dependent oxidoreductase, partial [Pseudorhodoplanes sp.]|nr:FAD-dependent oxidoreductase [Pseudorhodoplanes sp.]
MVRTDVVVLGAGVVGTSAALHLAKAGVSVALVDRRAPGEETSFGNAGIIESNTFFPYPVPPLSRLFAIATKQATEANYHLSHLPRLLPWLLAYARASTPQAMLDFAHKMRPLFSRASIEHEALLTEAGAERYLRKNGWLKIYRTQAGFDKAQADLDVIAKEGIVFEVRGRDECLALEPALAPVFRNGVFWSSATSISSPLGVTRAYAQHFTKLGGTILQGDALKLHRSGHYWRVETDEGPLDASQAVVALGPWGQDLLDRLGLKLPLQAKRGYHRHFRPRGNSGLSRPVLDAERGYLVAPMEQGLRLTTGAEFALRDAPPTPVQFDRLMPA